MLIKYLSLKFTEVSLLFKTEKNSFDFKQNQKNR